MDSTTKEKDIVYRCGPYLVVVSIASGKWRWSITGKEFEQFSIISYPTPGRALKAAFAALPTR